MSSNEESEDEFESADEDLDCEPIDKRLQFKSEDLEVEDTQNGEHFQWSILASIL